MGQEDDFGIAGDGGFEQLGFPGALGAGDTDDARFGQLQADVAQIGNVEGHVGTQGQPLPVVVQPGKVTQFDRLRAALFKGGNPSGFEQVIGSGFARAINGRQLQHPDGTTQGLKAFAHLHQGQTDIANGFAFAVSIEGEGDGPVAGGEGQQVRVQ